ncbi:DNA repair and recombination protein RAD52-like [Cotesia glomerata]|uniref:DNA repair and recombination protein RAD52-like n=1 Tax=Cotesia glomerata TaxID=32391 RepID=UPI001D02DE8E|nr:DNA repair and recombination protein RAD52-like [Cotesia glomerata]
MNLDNLNLETLIIHGDMAFTNDNWSHELKKQIIDYVGEVNGTYIVGCTTVVKVFLRDGRTHEAMSFKESRSESIGAAYDEARNKSFHRALYDAFTFFWEFMKIMEKLSNEKVQRMVKQQQLKAEWNNKNIVKN